MKIDAEPRIEASPRDEERDADLVIREARRRQRRRRMGVVGVAIVLVISGLIAAGATGAGRSGPPGPPHARTQAQPPGAPSVPATPTFSAGQFAGTWRAHTTSVSIGPDGTGTASWPGPIAPGGSEATALPNTAALRLTEVNGSQATAVVSGSTDQAELPDGAVRLQITDQDLLQIVPAQPMTVTPLRWSALCGASALALTLTQQVAAGINCGA